MRLHQACRVGESPSTSVGWICAAGSDVDAGTTRRASMHIAAIFSFIIGAILGLVMAYNHFTGVSSGKAFGLGHGAFTVSGLVLLGVGLLYSPDLGAPPFGGAWLAFWAFLLTATGGIYLFVRQSKGKDWPNAVVIAHGAAALLSIALLIVLLLGNNGASRDAEPGIVPVTPGADGGEIIGD